MSSASCYFNSLPDELILKEIFSKLSFADLSCTACVCRRWNSVSLDPSLWRNIELLSKIKVIQAREWNALVNCQEWGLSFNGLSHLTQAYVSRLHHLQGSLPIEEDAGITYLTIPQGLTLNKLIQIAQSILHLRLDIAPELIQRSGDHAVAQSYRLAIANEILVKSERKTQLAQDQYVHQKGCQVPNVLEVCAQVVLTEVLSHRKLYSNVSAHCMDGDICYVVKNTPQGICVAMSPFYGRRPVVEKIGTSVCLKI